MQDYELTLKAPISDSFMAKKAMQSVDLDSDQKAWHKLALKAVDVTTSFNVGLVYGASGSGKSTIAKHIFGAKSLESVAIDYSRCVIDQFPDVMSYDERQNLLNSIGLSQIPCWIKPIGMLSNGQQERAKIALNLAVEKDLYVFDEWTSVVDRNVARVMSHAVQKFARKAKKRVVLISCHQDVFEWLNPDWLIDCNAQTYEDRRSLRQTFERSERLTFSVHEVGSEAWKPFSKYHYLSDTLPGGKTKHFGLFLGDKQIGFVSYANYVPHRKGTTMIMHYNRVVIHPDYVGLGLGMKFVNATAALMVKAGYRVMGKFSSVPMLKASLKDKHNWSFREKMNHIKVKPGGNMQRKGGFRQKVTTYSFEYIGKSA